MPSKTAANPNFALRLILIAAIGGSIFTIAAGALVYHTTSGLISAAKWVQHTQEVLTSLQSTGQFMDRVEAGVHVYMASKDQADLESARAAVLRLQATANRLHGQVLDNPAQVPRTIELEDCATRLAETLTTQVSPDDASFTSRAFRCRQNINAMTEEERRLLRERTEASQKESSNSLITDVAFAAFSLLFLFILFSFLVRDALARRKIASQTNAMNEELATSIAALRDQAVESRMLTTARDELQLCVNLRQVYDCAARTVLNLLPESAGFLGMIDNSRHLVERVSFWGQDRDASHFPDIFPPASCCGLRSGAARRRQHGLSEIHCSHFDQEPPESYLCMPMMAQGETIGVLFLEVTSAATDALVEQRLELLRQIVPLIGMSIASLQLRLKLEQQSIRDPLTGLFNRHFMQIALSKELARCKRKGSSLAVLMLDVDHFKTFNDRFGHTVGDSVLQSVSTLFQAAVRTEDFVCRYGGEEFIIVLPEISVEAAWGRAEAIRLEVAQLAFSFEGLHNGEVTISIGVALSSGEISDPLEIIRQADKALYQAKKSGRNRVVLADEEAPIRQPALAS